MVALSSGKVILLSVIFARSRSSGEHSMMRRIMAKTNSLGIIVREVALDQKRAPGQVCLKTYSLWRAGGSGQVPAVRGIAIVDVFDAGLLAQFCDAQPRREALVLSP